MTNKRKLKIRNIILTADEFANLLKGYYIERDGMRVTLEHVNVTPYVRIDANAPGLLDIKLGITSAMDPQTIANGVDVALKEGEQPTQEATSDTPV